MAASKTRLNKFLAEAGLGSRRKVESLIFEGRVCVNGKVIKEPGFKVGSDDLVTVDGQPVELQPKVYIAFNKPAGVLTTSRDERKRLTVMDLIPFKEIRVFPVGRLDRASKGLLLLTNDGELAYRLMHPKYHVPKVYIVRVKGHPSGRDINRLRKGVWINGVKTRECEIVELKKTGGTTTYRVVLTEGRKRQIRIMFKMIGHPVIELTRVAVGNITLKGLPEGHFRFLTEEEVQQLKRMVKLI